MTRLTFSKICLNPRFYVQWTLCTVAPNFCLSFQQAPSAWILDSLLARSSMDYGKQSQFEVPSLTPSNNKEKGFKSDVSSYVVLLC